jgi:hypothetical protein
VVERIGLAYRWHLARRHREQGRLTSVEWMTWADEYIEALEDSPWKTWCQRQVSEFRAVFYFVHRD